MAIGTQDLGIAMTISRFVIASGGNSMADWKAQLKRDYEVCYGGDTWVDPEMILPGISNLNYYKGVTRESCEFFWRTPR